MQFSDSLMRSFLVAFIAGTAPGLYFFTAVHKFQYLPSWILVTSACQLFVTRLLSHTRWRVPSFFHVLELFRHFDWQKRLPNISQKLKIVLQYPYVESIALSFGDSNIPCIELCHSIDTKFFCTEQ